MVEEALVVGGRPRTSVNALGVLLRVAGLAVQVLVAEIESDDRVVVAEGLLTLGASRCVAIHKKQFEI